ncbi:MAG: hypothetical protein IPI67_39300 [Myxococcales bacterium]|nr:hypothetical protein [Myxococcales bacterium]
MAGLDTNRGVRALELALGLACMACAGGEEDLLPAAGTGGGPADASSDLVTVEDSAWGVGGSASDAAGSGGSAGGGGSSSGGGTSSDGGLVAEYLHPGRTYDEESAYVKWSGYVEFVPLAHKDGTSLPPSEGGGSCASGCTEQVTKISDGASVWGLFKGVTSINVQLASTSEAGVGTGVFEACNQSVGSYPLSAPGSGQPGFNNFPATAWSVPTQGECVWKVTAKGGFVYFRAVTVTP